jgi:hydrogenase maturation protein HypF
MSEIEGVRINVTGVVQGVGFRPFIFGLATRLGLLGWVRNTSAGVDIQLDGTAETIQTFMQALRNEAPPLARIDEVTK